MPQVRRQLAGLVVVVRLLLRVVMVVVVVGVLVWVLVVLLVGVGGIRFQVVQAGLRVKIHNLII